MMGGLNGADLDRHITGNYGADQNLNVCDDDECPMFDECEFDHSLPTCDDDARTAADEARADV